MMKKQLLSFALILVLVMGLTACSSKTDTPTGNGSVADGTSSKPTDNSSPVNNENLMGNTNGNLVNGGRVAISGEWIYYSLLDGMYRLKSDGTEKEMLYGWDTNTNPSPLCIVGEWIYYKRFCPYKIRLDGTEQQQINDFESIGSFRVIGDSMYFGCEYKMKTDGSDVQQIYDKNGASGNTVNNVDGWIYCYDSDSEGNDSIFKFKTDGTDRQKIYSGRTDFMIVDDDWIYYEEYDSKDLYKMKTDGSDNQLIVEEVKISALNVDNDWIYYGGSDGLCKIKTDGSDKQVLCADNANDICIIGDWIYYDISGSDYMKSLYRIRTDGSDRQIISGEGAGRPSSTTENGLDEAAISLETKNTIELNTYATKFGETNAVTYPSFTFDYSDNWTISEEEVTQLTERVTLKNDRGVEITYAHFSSSITGGGSAVAMERVEVSKAADSNFVPDYVQATDHSNLGAFMVAKLKVTGTLNMQSDSDFKDVDGSVSYAVLPETQIGTSTARTVFMMEFAFDYSGHISFTCESPNGEFTEAEEQEVIEILTSFRIAE